MATLQNVAGTDYARFTPLSTALNNLPNGAGTIATLFRRSDNTGAGQDLTGLVAPNTAAAVTVWYHTLGVSGPLGSFRISDDDGMASVQEPSTWTGSTDWYIFAVTWPAGGAAIERFHRVDQSSPAGWTHTNAGLNNGGNRAGPGTSSGAYRIGTMDDGFAVNGEFAVVAAWAGVALSDAQCAELSVNNKTSDWWNNSGGQPTLLVECNTTSLVDIGANASTFASVGGLTLTGGTPTWTFDGHGVAAIDANPMLDVVHAGRFGPF